MKIDMTIHKGEWKRPVVVLIHGLSMDKRFWLDPLNTKFLANNIPLRVFTAKHPKPREDLRGRKITIGDVCTRVRSLWDVLREKGFNLICWSQRRPVGPICGGVDELIQVVNMARDLFPGSRIALIGHSRGGLIARKFLEKESKDVSALITIATPHRGSSFAGIGTYLEPFSETLKRFVPRSDRNMVSRTMKNIMKLLEERAWKELMPNSAFLTNLKDRKRRGIHYVSLGGDQPRLFTLYVWKRFNGKVCARRVISFPDSLLKVVPPILNIEEIVPGKGDGLVTLESSEMPWISDHHVVAANHVSIVWNEKTVDTVLDVLNAMC